MSPDTNSEVPLSSPDSTSQTPTPVNQPQQPVQSLASLESPNPQPNLGPAASVITPTTIAPSSTENQAPQHQGIMSPAQSPTVSSVQVTTTPTSSTESSVPATSPAILSSGDPPAQSGAVVSMHQTEGLGKPKFTDGGKRKLSNKLILPVVILLVLIGGGAGAYFGYWMNPGVIWSQAIDNMNGGYGKLINYLNTKSSTHYKGFSENGSFTLASGDTHYSGSLNSASDGSNSTLSAKVDYGTGTIGVEERGITNPDNNLPDVYLQVNGIKTIDSSLGGVLGPQIDGLDGQWIVIDHNLLADLKSIAVKNQSNTSAPPLTWADINSFLKAAGTVNQQYLFTTNKNAATKVVKRVGKETVNGHSTYHYKVGFNDANLKAYVTAMCAALQNSDLGGYIKSQTGQLPTTSSTCTNLENRASQVKSTDTLDVWVDTSTRLIYKVRVSDTTSGNPAQNYIEVGLNYKGGNSYPFFVNFTGSDSTGTVNANAVFTLNSQTSSVTMTLNASGTDSSGTKGTITGNLSFVPTNTTLTVATPAGAQPLATVLNNLGLGQYLTMLQSLGSNSHSVSSPVHQAPPWILTALKQAN